MKLIDRMKAAKEVAEQTALNKINQEYEIRFALIKQTKDPVGLVNALKACIRDYEHDVDQIQNNFVPSPF